MRFSFLIFCLIFIACSTKHTPPDGGYSFLTNLNDTDTNNYHFPLKDIFTKEDSFYHSIDSTLYESFNEPNLSIKPFTEEIYRFLYFSPMTDPIIVKLFKNKIIVKKAISGQYYHEKDTLNLTPVEREHYRILDWNFPIDIYLKEKDRKSYRYYYIDSIAKVYPELLDPVYYKYLLAKASLPIQNPLIYEETEVNITKSSYERIVKAIKNSGYWKMPPIASCPITFTDGHSYMLEANNTQKYNFIIVLGCPVETDPARKLTAVCDELMSMAGLSNDIGLIWSGGIDTVDLNEN